MNSKDNYTGYGDIVQQISMASISGLMEGRHIQPKMSFHDIFAVEKILLLLKVFAMK